MTSPAVALQFPISSGVLATTLARGFRSKGNWLLTKEPDHSAWNENMVDSFPLVLRVKLLNEENPLDEELLA